jgi:hypothetical protein
LNKGGVLTPDDVLAKLKAGAKSSRTVNSLDLIHRLCDEQHKRGSIDFSIATIGRLSAAQGGPSEQPLRNASDSAKVYRALIEAWARHVDGKRRKPPAEKALGGDEQLLSMIDDLVARNLVGAIISENRKLRNENQALKVVAKGSVTIDMRPAKKVHSTEAVQVVSPLDLLEQEELDALRSAISAETLKYNAWKMDERGGITNRAGLSVFRPGFGLAIKKILSEAEGA